MSEGEKAAGNVRDISKSRYARKLKKKVKMQGKKGSKTARSSASKPTAAQDAGAFAMCLLPFFFALLFRDIGKTLAVPMVLFFLMIFLMNGDQALFISRILPMGQLRLIALQQFTPSMVQFVFTDFLWIE